MIDMNNEPISEGKCIAFVDKSLEYIVISGKVKYNCANYDTVISTIYLLIEDGNTDIEVQKVETYRLVT